MHFLLAYLWSAAQLACMHVQAPIVLPCQPCECSQVSAELSGWRTSTGLLLREPATASVDYTPALAK